MVLNKEYDEHLKLREEPHEGPIDPFHVVLLLQSNSLGRLDIIFYVYDMIFDINLHM